MAAEQLFTEKEAMLDALKVFLSSLPSDTKSIQILASAFTDNYDNYNDKTKCVKESDIWWNLSADDQMELLSESVTTTLKSVAEVMAMPGETEDEQLSMDEAISDLEVNFKQLARSFAMTLGEGATDNLDTAAMAELQMERLFDGVLGFGNRQLFQKLITAFQRKKNLAEAVENLQWSLMSKGGAKKTQVNKPIGKPAVPAPTRPIATPPTNGITPTDNA